MPVVAVVDDILVMFFFNDHDPPHFHVEYAEFRARIRIDTFEIIEGRLPIAKRRKLLQWAREHQDQLPKSMERSEERTEAAEDTMTEWPRLVSATPLGGYRLRLVYSDGFACETDFSEKVARGGIFAFMRDPERFKQVRVAHGGTALQWIDDIGDEIDFDGHAQRLKAEAEATAAAE